MVSLPTHAQVAGSTIGLGLGLPSALLALAIALLIVWRREALRQAANPAAHAWFAFAIRVQWLVAASSFVLPAAVWMAEPSRALIALLPATAPYASAWNVALIVLPSFALSTMAMLVSGDVERRLRGSGLGARERLAHVGSVFAVVLLPIAGLAASSAALAGGHVRSGLGYAFAGVLAGLWFASTRSGVLGLRSEAATSGPLRDRLFELAARAKVRVRQVYVLSSSRMRLANAFAVRGGNVLVTSDLLSQLSRREVEGVIAHELAHLRHRHPAKLGMAFAAPLFAFSATALLGFGPRAWSHAGALAFLLGGLSGLVSLRWWSRRFEYQADRGAIELTGDAPGLITALVRIAELNSTPLDWSRAQEWMLTHPSVRRRARALAAAGFVTEAEVETLLAAPAAQAEHWTVPAAAKEPVFGSAAKRARVAATSWGLLLATAGAPAVLLALLRATGVHAAWPPVFALATLIAFGAALAAVDLLATRGYPRWERMLAERRGREPGEGCLIGLAPCADGMTYEGFADWDLGYVDLDPVTLRYEGERTRFALERAAIVSIDAVAGLPGWLPAPRVAIRWRAADGSEHAFSIRDARARTLHAIPATTLRLLAELRQWHTEPAPAGVRALALGEPPRPDAVTGTTHAELGSPRLLLPIVVIVAGLALLIALVMGLPLEPGRGPGAVEAMGAAVLAAVAMRVPLWRAGRAGRRAVKRGSTRAA